MTQSGSGDRKWTRREFEAEVYSFMAEMREHQRNQTINCTSHATKQEDLEQRTKSLEDTRSSCSGALKVMGVPTFGSLSWMLYEFFTTIKKLKGG